MMKTGTKKRGERIHTVLLGNERTYVRYQHTIRLYHMSELYFVHTQSPHAILVWKPYEYNIIYIHMASRLMLFRKTWKWEVVYQLKGSKGYYRGLEKERYLSEKLLQVQT